MLTTTTQTTVRPTGKPIGYFSCGAEPAGKTLEARFGPYLEKLSRSSKLALLATLSHRQYEQEQGVPFGSYPNLEGYSSLDTYGREAIKIAFGLTDVGSLALITFLSNNLHT